MEISCNTQLGQLFFFFFFVAMPCSMALEIFPNQPHAPCAKSTGIIATESLGKF